jgi:preprotein translocase subunit SecG
MKRTTLVLTFFFLTCAATFAPACPMCKDSISDTARSGDFAGRGAEQALPGGFNTSIYYMLIGLFATTGLVVGVITKGIRSTNAAHRSAPSLPE